jgi:hypothetical protein
MGTRALLISYSQSPSSARYSLGLLLSVQLFHVPDCMCFDLIQSNFLIYLIGTPKYNDYFLQQLQGAGIRCCSCSCKVQTARWMMVRISGTMLKPVMSLILTSSILQQLDFRIILLLFMCYSCDPKVSRLIQPN